MAARTATRGLSTSELEQIRESLAAGRRPKVVFTKAAGQIAGQQGQVVELTDPKLGDEWVVVRFGRDELPFSPADLAIPPKGATTRRAVKAAPSPPPLAPPAPPVPTPREERTVKAATAPSPSADSAPADAKPQPPARAAKAPARKAAKGKAPAGLTVTLAYADGEWTVAAHKGSKVLAKPYFVKPADALKMVAMLDVAGVHEAVEDIVAAARADAEAQAQRLRSELADIEARLAELREAR